MTRFFTVFFAIFLPFGAMAQQDQTLADIRQELNVLYVEVQRLKRELSTTGAVGGEISGGSALERIDAIEVELRRLTGKTEELEFRIDRVVRDGTNRIGDLEFRLVELEGGDVSQLGETSTLGGIEPATGSSQPVATPETGSVELAVGEAADFERAKAALDAGEYAQAAELFATFNETYPGGPMAAEAHLLRGRALDGNGDMTSAARAYLEGFSLSPNGAVAPETLYRLGQALGGLGQTDEACLMLGEVEVRFPEAGVVPDARSAMGEMGCP